MLLLSLKSCLNSNNNKSRIFILFITINLINNVASSNLLFGLPIGDSSSSILSRLINSFTLRPPLISNTNPKQRQQQQQVKVPTLVQSSNKNINPGAHADEVKGFNANNVAILSSSSPSPSVVIAPTTLAPILAEIETIGTRVPTNGNHVELGFNRTTTKRPNPNKLTTKAGLAKSFESTNVHDNNKASVVASSIKKLDTTNNANYPSAAINLIPLITSPRPGKSLVQPIVVEGNSFNNTNTPSRLSQTSQLPAATSNNKQLTKDRLNFENALNVEGVKCGTVPMFEKIFRRSYYESAESAGKFRILHGIDSFQGEWPWIVRIQECPEEDSCATCTGTLLNSRWLITAGHCCFNRSSVDKFSATFGLYDLIRPERESFTVGIDKIIVHPEYKDLANDLTLMRLKKEVKFDDFVQPACLIHATRNILEYTKNRATYTVGYGLTEGMVGAVRLQKLLIQTRPPSECNSDEMGNVELHRGTICIGPPDGKEGSSCKGDSGGPDLVYDSQDNKWLIFGTVSYGPADCDREEGDKWLTVSVDLSNYRTWILKTVLLNSL